MEICRTKSVANWRVKFIYYRAYIGVTGHLLRSYREQLVGVERGEIRRFRVVIYLT